MSNEALETALQEGVDTASIDAFLAEKDEGYEPTVEDLRGLFGERVAEVSDEELMKAYVSTAEKAEEKKAEEAAPWDRPYTVIGDDGKPLPDPRSMLGKLLEAKLQTKVNGEAKEFTLDEAVRHIQRSVVDAQRINTLLEQRNLTAKERDELRGEMDGLRKEKKIWTRILADRSGELYKSAQQKFEESLVADGEEAPAGPAASPFTPEQDAAGEAVYQRDIMPHVRQLARGYSLDGKAPPAELVQHVEQQADAVVRHLIAQEGRFITSERVADILRFEIPGRLYEAGYRAVAAAAAPATTESERVKALEAEIASLKGEKQKAKLAKAPDAGDTSAGTPGAAGKFLSLKGKSARDIQRMLEDPAEKFGM